MIYLIAILIIVEIFLSGYLAGYRAHARRADADCLEERLRSVL